MKRGTRINLFQTHALPRIYKFISVASPCALCADGGSSYARQKVCVTIELIGLIELIIFFWSVSSSVIFLTSIIIKHVAKPSKALISTLLILISINEVDSVKFFNKCFLSSKTIFNLTKNEESLFTSHSTSINLSFCNRVIYKISVFSKTSFNLV